MSNLSPHTNTIAREKKILEVTPERSIEFTMPDYIFEVFNKALSHPQRILGGRYFYKPSEIYKMFPIEQRRLIKKKTINPKLSRGAKYKAVFIDEVIYV